MQRAPRTGLTVLAALIAAAVIALGATHHLGSTPAEFLGTASAGSDLAARPDPNRIAAIRGIILALTRNRITLRRRNGYVITMDEGRALANRSPCGVSCQARTV